MQIIPGNYELSYVVGPDRPTLTCTQDQEVWLDVSCSGHIEGPETGHDVRLYQLWSAQAAMWHTDTHAGSRGFDCNLDWIVVCENECNWALRHVVVLERLLSHCA